jgi:hypothetical protein
MMAALSEWLQIMLAEIARKREDEEHAREEDRRRERENAKATSASETVSSQAASETHVAQR